MADISRTQFDESKRVEKKILQQGTHLLDSDFNEVVDVLQNRSRRQLAMLVGGSDVRFGNGWAVEGTGASLQVTVKAGWGAFMLAANSAVLLQLASDLTLSGFTTWSGARTDYIYLDIWEDEIGPDTDPNLINPLLGQPSMVDIRLQYSLEISEGAVPGAPPAGHAYVTLASITKTAGGNIDAGDVTLVLPESAHGSVGTDQLVDDSVTKEKINADVAGSGLAQAGDGSLTLAPDGITAAMLAGDVAGDGLQQAAGGELDVVGVTNQAGAILKYVTLTGTWDMDQNMSFAIAHGLDRTKIRGAHVVIQSNQSTQSYLLDHGINGTAAGWVQFDATQIVLTRKETGFFDVFGFNDATYYATIIYEA